MNNNISYIDAVLAVLTEVNLNENEARGYDASLSGNQYRVTFRTDYLKYEAYVDAVTGEVLGLDFEPTIYVETAAALDPSLSVIPTDDDFAA